MGEGGDGYGYAPSGRIWLRLRAQRRIWLYLGICAALYLRGKLKSGPITAFRRAQVEPTGTELVHPHATQTTCKRHTA